MLTRTIKDSRSKSYRLDAQEEVGTQSIHDKIEQLVPSTSVLLYPVTCFFQSNEENSYGTDCRRGAAVAIGPVMANANATIRKRVVARAIMVMTVCKKSNVRCG
jgi:hypothetical protein